MTNHDRPIVTMTIDGRAVGTAAVAEVVTPSTGGGNDAGIVLPDAEPRCIAADIL